MENFAVALQELCRGSEALVTWGPGFTHEVRDGDSLSHGMPYRYQQALPRGMYRMAHVAVLRLELRELGGFNRSGNGREKEIEVIVMNLDQLDSSPDHGIRTFIIRESVSGVVSGWCVIGSVQATKGPLDAEKGDVCALTLCELAAKCGLLELSVEL